MELHEVEVVIDRDGEVRIEVHGLKGRGCLDLTADLIEALGGDVLEQEPTAEASELAPGTAEWVPTKAHIQRKP